MIGLAVYVYIDVSQKQEYIYRNNKLADNLYYSFIIKAVTEKLTEDEEKREDLLEELKDFIYLEKYLSCEKFKGQYTFIYSGGGNSIIRFEECKKAKEFIRGYSFEILEYYPDLELYISLVDEKEFDVECNEHKEKEIRELLARRCDKLKDKRRAQYKRWTCGVEKIEQDGQAKKLVFDENLEKTGKEKNNIARKYLFNRFEKALPKVDITSRLEEYKKEDKSYIGVISIDGNRMGDIVKKINSFSDLREISRLIDKIYFDAITETLKTYFDKMALDKLLMTPVLQAGDDICIIVEAGHAISIAADIIKKIKTLSESESNRKVLEQFLDSGYLTACAGVAIVRYSYPFFEAVKVAENLCSSAKELSYINVMETNGMQNKSFINWEVVQSQVPSNIIYKNYLRNRNIQEKYHIKPLCIDQEDCVKNNIFNYDVFDKMTREVIKKIKENEISNSMLEELRKQIYGGIEQYKLFLDIKKDTKKLRELIQNILDSNVDSYMIFSGAENNLVNYVINDVLDILPFIFTKEGEFID